MYGLWHVHSRNAKYDFFVDKLCQWIYKNMLYRCQKNTFATYKTVREGNISNVSKIESKNGFLHFVVSRGKNFSKKKDQSTIYYLWFHNNNCFTNILTKHSISIPFFQWKSELLRNISFDKWSHIENTISLLNLKIWNR